MQQEKGVAQVIAEAKLITWSHTYIQAPMWNYEVGKDNVRRWQDLICYVAIFCELQTVKLKYKIINNWVVKSDWSVEIQLKWPVLDPFLTMPLPHPLLAYQKKGMAW